MALWVDLKAWFYLANAAPLPSGKIETVFLGDIILWATFTSLSSLLPV